MRHFLSITETPANVLNALVDFSIVRKQQFRRGELTPAFQGRILAMIFQKSSLRTRLGFEAAMAQLGGHAINLEDHQIGLTRRESPRDVARVISSMADVIMARVYAHQSVVELAANATVPVINGLSDWAHPCQAVADLMTIKEHFGRLAGLRMAFIGDANNVARSLLNACVKSGMSFAIASPEGYQLDPGVVQHARGASAQSGIEILTCHDPAEAAAGADVVYTDVWTSMGQEAEQAEREKAFAAFQVNAELMRRAKPTAVAMHCLPAHRGSEITDEVIDGPQSVIFEQAENRLHSQRALLEVLLSRKK
ncbi:MAG TPA: ornithine carbamoyltransferase [Phycisphaerae bacterium]|nr:ornithine carbamoyltransferase [Phycisphaerae bacterium]